MGHSSSVRLSVSPSLQIKMAEKGKGRRSGRVEMRRIDNPIRRQVTFSKRKAGLFKKADELSLLCDVDLALIISSPSGKLYHSPAPIIDKALRRYQKHFASPEYYIEDYENIELLQLELEKQRELEIELERMQKHMNGEDLECLSFKEIQYLERQMKIGATKIRSKKEMLLQKDIRFLKTKLGRREVGTDDNDLEEGPINGAVDDHINERVDDHQQARQRDGVARPQTNLQYHKNLSLSLC